MNHVNDILEKSLEETNNENERITKEIFGIFCNLAVFLEKKSEGIVNSCFELILK